MSEQTPGLWGEQSLDVDQSIGYQLGPLALQLSHCEHEWRISYSHDLNWAGEEGDVILQPQQWSEELEKLERYMFRKASDSIQITPLLADRPVVTRPVSPVHLLSGEEVTLFISSPLWLKISLDGGKKQLMELPIIRPSDTWFGPNTFEGELCYDSRTHGRLTVEELGLRMHRAITPVLIHNQAKSDLKLERISIPVPLLSLYENDQGQLWTEPVTLTRSEDSEMAALKIGKGAPKQAGKCKLLTAPRHTSDKGLLYRAFSQLF